MLILHSLLYVSFFMESFLQISRSYFPLTFASGEPSTEVHMQFLLVGLLLVERFHFLRNWPRLHLRQFTSAPGLTTCHAFHEGLEQQSQIWRNCCPHTEEDIVPSAPPNFCTQGTDVYVKDLENEVSRRDPVFHINDNGLWVSFLRSFRRVRRTVFS